MHVFVPRGGSARRNLPVLTRLARQAGALRWAVRCTARDLWPGYPHAAGVAQLACARKADMRYDFKDAVLRLRCELAYIPR